MVGADALKVALGCVMFGGGSAAVVGRLEARGVRAELEAHSSGTHPKTDAEMASMRAEFIGQASEARQSAQQAAYDANRSVVLMEMLLKAQGIRPPEPPPRPPLDDAGARDAGR